MNTDEVRVWREANKGVLEMWRMEHFEAEILKRKFEGLREVRAWQEVVWSGLCCCCQRVGSCAVEAREGAAKTRGGEVEAGAGSSKEVAFVVIKVLSAREDSSQVGVGWRGAVEVTDSSRSSEIHLHTV